MKQWTSQWPPTVESGSIKAKAFKEWFDGSVVRNEDGSPKVVYHGTDRHFKKFNIEKCGFGCHFGTKTQADAVTGRLGKGKVRPYYLSIKNPIRLADTGTWESWKLYRAIYASLDDYSVTLHRYALLDWDDTDENKVRRIRDWLICKGYDGVVYLNRGEGIDWDSYENNLFGGMIDEDDTPYFQEQASDELFKQVATDAEDSYIAFLPSQIRAVDAASNPMRVGPHAYYTKERLDARQINQPPPVLFHFCEPSSAIRHLRNGFLRGSGHVLCTTENPSFSSAGRYVFVIDSKCLLDRGFVIYPYFFEAAEAEWRIAPPNSSVEFPAPSEPHAFFEVPVDVPFDCVMMIGYWGRQRGRDEEIGEVKKAASAHGYEMTKGFNWTDWWDDGPLGAKP